MEREDELNKGATLLWGLRVNNNQALLYREENFLILNGKQKLKRLDCHQIHT